MYFNLGRMPGFCAFAALIVVFATSDGLADSRAPLTLVEAEDIALRDEPGLSEFKATADALGERSVAAGQPWRSRTAQGGRHAAYIGALPLL